MTDHDTDIDPDPRLTVSIAASTTPIDHLADFQAFRGATWSITDTLDRVIPDANSGGDGADD